MNLKALLIFLTIFILGFGSGFLVSGRLTKNSIEAVKERESPVGFKKDLYKYLNPDERQKQIIDSIVADYIPKIKEERAISRMYQKNLRDSMFVQIQSLLDTKQKKNLKKFEEEKLIKKPQPKIAKQKDTIRTTTKITRKERIEQFKESLTPEQKLTLDSILEKKPRRHRNPEMNKEIRQYARANIVPVLRKYRSEFEEELNDDERQIIAGWRQKRNELIKAELLGIGDEETKEKQDALISEARISLGSIINNHKKSLEEMAETLKPERLKWQADIDEIKVKYYPDYKPGEENEFKNKEKNAIDFLLMKGDRKPGRRLKK